MKKLLLTFALVLIALLGFSQSVTHVNGYYKKDGTYVAPHDQTKSNSTAKDNWSSKPNTNPETGTKGTKTVPYENTNNHTIYTGSKGGKYYINSKGNKTYVPKK